MFIWQTYAYYSLFVFSNGFQYNIPIFKSIRYYLIISYLLGHRLLLRKIIPLSKQKKARVLITWIPNINNDKPLFPHTDIFTLQWTRIDPISYENLSLPFTRLISWPDANNHVLMKSIEKASMKQKYSEYLITVDELLMEATYLFQLIETNFSQPINITVNDEKMCSSKTELLVSELRILI